MPLSLWESRRLSGGEGFFDYCDLDLEVRPSPRGHFAYFSGSVVFTKRIFGFEESFNR